MKRKVKKAINIFKKKIEKLLKTVYHKIPISQNFKTKAKNMFFTVFGFCLKNTSSYIVWKQTKVKINRHKNIKIITNEEFMKKPFEKKIAIQLHLYYLDLIDEFLLYFSNMPYKFDLFISVVDESQNEDILEKAKKISKLEKIIIKKVENRGRDVAPFIVDFSKELVKYEYICHVHSKKSLYAGKEQTGWRTYLLNGLFGSKEHIYNIFYQFETVDNVALIYPETYPALPYWGHTWLSNDLSRIDLMEKIGFYDVEFDNYVDFPMGTMFWARTDSIIKFFLAGIKTTDFPKEMGQLDGTIAHAFERCLGAVVKLEGNQIVTYDMEEDRFRYAYGKKNLNQYWDKSIEQLKNLMFEYDVITFDIFDTLVCRKISNPLDVFKAVEKELLYKDINIPFLESRQKAEKRLRKSGKQKDYTIDEIYAEMGKILNISKDVCDIIKQIEIQVEKRYIVPRYEIAKLLVYAKKELNKQVVLISDMYFTTDVLTDILTMCNIVDYDEIYVSCEKQARKDDGTMWNMIVNKYNPEKILHIGDNEKSDIQLAGDRKINTYHILEGKKLYELTNVGKMLDIPAKTILESIVKGIEINKYFNNPFSMNKCQFNNRIETMYDFGFVVIGPIVCDYLIWVIKNAKIDKINHLLMLAREGYLFQDIFDIMKKELTCLDETTADYVYASRRATLVATLKSKEDIKEALSKYFEGTTHELLQNRFGINDVEDIENQNIELPGDSFKVFEQIKTKIDIILDNSMRERNNYSKYINSKIRDDKVAVLDIGYSGSIQYYLSKIIDKPLTGYYFATDNKKLALNISGNRMLGRYIENDEIQPASTSYIHRYSMILEAVLTSVDNQFCYIDNNGLPVFKKDEITTISKKNILDVHNGAKDFSRELFSLVGDELFALDECKDMCENLIKSIVEKDVLADDLKKLFILEDQFCTSGTINIFEKLKNYKDE